MRKHAYDLTTGELVAVYPAPSPQDDARYQYLGLEVVESTQNLNRERYHYPGGVLTAKQEVVITSDKGTIAADGVDAATITVDPICDIIINGVLVAAADIGPVITGKTGVIVVEVAEGFDTDNLFGYYGAPLAITAE